MHILAIILGLLGTALWWTIRLSANRKNIGEAAHMIETPIEAATVLMIMIARAGESRRIEETERTVMEAQLVANMQLSADDADGTIRQLDSLTHDIVLPESAITPMTKVLREHIGRDDAQDLVDMLVQVASAEDAPDINQKEFLRRFREGFDLN